MGNKKTIQEKQFHFKHCASGQSIDQSEIFSGPRIQVMALKNPAWRRKAKLWVKRGCLQLKKKHQRRLPIHKKDVGRGAELVESKPFDRRVVGSNSAQATK